MLPYALQYGMSLEEFWFGEAELFFAYRSAYLASKKEQIELMNYSAWLNGLYNVRALWSVNGMIHASEDSRDDIPEYFDKPIDIFGDKEKPKEDAIIKQKIKHENNIKVLVAQTQIKLMNEKKKKKPDKE